MTHLSERIGNSPRPCGSSDKQLALRLKWNFRRYRIRTVHRRNREGSRIKEKQQKIRWAMCTGFAAMMAGDEKCQLPNARVAC